MKACVIVRRVPAPVGLNVGMKNRDIAKECREAVYIGQG
jgi:hypothetical protein